MSKESKPRDLWNQALGKRDLTGWCPGCGLHPALAGGVHRADCTRDIHHVAVLICADPGCPCSERFAA